MSRRTDLPSDEIAAQTAASVLAEAAAAGHRISVLAVARRLGLTNTTFRRHYPHLTLQIAEHRRTALNLPAATPSPAPGPHAQMAALRRHNRNLTQQLNLAVASIQRLALDNHRLREELESVSSVTRLPRPAL